MTDGGQRRWANGGGGAGPGREAWVLGSGWWPGLAPAGRGVVLLQHTSGDAAALTDR